jgi:orotate phosphoribosyltransferase/uridine monophosphate synthetase
MPPDSAQELTSLWLATSIFELGGIEFGDFTIGRSTINSPVFLNPKVLIGDPEALRTAANLVNAETTSRAAMRHPHCGPFDLVAGVPLGGLHIATAFSLIASHPMIYFNPTEDRDERRIEGRYLPGQSVLIVDDLITTGGSVIAAAEALRNAGLIVTDAVVLIDRDQGASHRLRSHQINLIPIIKLTTILNLYMSEGWISENQFKRSLDYIRSNRA